MIDFGDFIESQRSRRRKTKINTISNSGTIAEAKAKVDRILELGKSKRNKRRKKKEEDQS